MGMFGICAIYESVQIMGLFNLGGFSLKNSEVMNFGSMVEP